ncbi:MAG: Gfo/Idh/MocA family oxidoreductase [Acuticoccus sp.]
MGDKPPLRIGLVGAGFMGKTHVFGFAAAARVFDLPFAVELHTLADAGEAAARASAARLGVARATGDWRTLLADRAIDVIDITAPNALHKEMALAAIAAGKHVYCEKPLAPRAADARAMADAARAAGRVTQVGFNYLANPMLRQAREMIRRGDLGRIVSYRGIHAEDYMADPAAPYTFRHDPEGGGVLADLGSHALATAEFLLGPIRAVMGDCVTTVPTRTDARGTAHSIAVDDIARAFVRFQSGASGTIEANWVASGRKMQHDFEIYGEKGALLFSQERLNELHFHDAARPAGTSGFVRIEAGPAHPPYGEFCVAPGHQLGFNDLKAIEIAGFLDAIAGRCEEPFGFEAGWRIQSLVEAIRHSARTEAWVTTG